MKLVLAFAILASAAAIPSLTSWEGVYKTRFENGLVTGERYMSENILEIVPTSPGRAYVRAELEFFNGHICSIHGIAHQEGQALVYRTTLEGADGPKPCALRLERAAGQVRLDDEGGVCRSYYCGARGMFTGVTLPAASRRAIRYLPRLKASREFKEAMAADRAPPAPR